MKVRGSVVALVALIILVGPAPALALDPGDSALNQYVEQIPGVKGDEPTKPPSGEKPADVIGEGPARKLAGFGTDGATTAALAAGSAPEASTGESGKREGNGRVDGSSSASAPGNESSGRPIVSVAEGAFGVSGGSGFGWSLLILAVVVVTIAGMLVHRHQRNSTEG